MIYRFPRTRFVEQNSFKDQLDYATSEFMEAFTALDGGEGYQRVAEEVVDTIHALEGSLRILQEQHGINVADVVVYVQQKNSVRGYYCD